MLCLIQVATRERLAVIDPLAVRDVGPFWDVVLDPAVEVVMHAAGEDLRICLIRNRIAAPAGVRRPDGRGTGGPQLSVVPCQPGRSGAGHQPGRQRDTHRLAASAAHVRPSSITHSTTFGTCSIWPIISLIVWLKLGSNGLGRGRDWPIFIESIAAASRRRPLAAAAGLAPTEPPRPGDGPAPGRVARRRGKAAEPPAAPGRPRRSARGHRQAPAHELAATSKPCATSTGPRS